MAEMIIQFSIHPAFRQQAMAIRERQRKMWARCDGKQEWKSERMKEWKSRKNERTKKERMKEWKYERMKGDRKKEWMSERGKEWKNSEPRI